MLSLTSLLGQICSYSDMNMNYVAEKTQGENQGNNWKNQMIYDITQTKMQY